MTTTVWQRYDISLKWRLQDNNNNNTTTKMMGLWGCAADVQLTRSLKIGHLQSGFFFEIQVFLHQTHTYMPSKCFLYNRKHLIIRFDCNKHEQKPFHLLWEELKWQKISIWKFDVENILPTGKTIPYKMSKKKLHLQMDFFPISTFAIIEEIASRKFEDSNMTTP